MQLLTRYLVAGIKVTGEWLLLFYCTFGYWYSFSAFKQKSWFDYHVGQVRLRVVDN